MTDAEIKQRVFDEALVVSTLMDQPEKFQWEIASLQHLDFYHPGLGQLASIMRDMQESGDEITWQAVQARTYGLPKNYARNVCFSFGAEFGLEDALVRLQNIDKRTFGHVKVVAIRHLTKAEGCYDGYREGE